MGEKLSTSLIMYLLSAYYAPSIVIGVKCRPQEMTKVRLFLILLEFTADKVTGNTNDQC